MNVSDLDDTPTPTGELALQTVAMPADTNPRGDIFAGWLVSQMDMAAAIAALKVTQGRVATVAINSMNFLTAVHVGAIVSCYTDVINIGRSSMHINVEVWINHKETFEPVKVTDGEFVFVLIDNDGRTRNINK
jgi:acyl-CoA thioesterase YciA